MPAETNLKNEVKPKELLKLQFFFNRFVREAFKINENRQKVLSSYKNIVGKGNIVVKKLIDSDPSEEEADIQQDIENFIGKPHKLTSDTVSYNETRKEFIANTYGFIIIKNRKLQVLPLLSVSHDKLKAYLFIAKKIDDSLPSLEEIKELVSKNKLFYLRKDEIIKEEINKNGTGKNVLVAEGIKAIDGHVEFVELNKKEKNEIGKELESGRIDYKEKDNLLLVKKDEIIARKIERIEPKDGYDVFGVNTKGNIKGKNKYSIGKNINPSQNNPNIYIANIDGGLSIEKDGTICVEERIVIEDDVNIETGNIHFEGFVEIKGNITKGFIVDAGKDLIVRGNIEDASVNANGSIYVQNGIIGEKTRVFTKKNVFAKFIQSASIKSEQNIEVVDSIVQGNCLAKEHINVEGKVVGGKIHGYLGVNLGTVGSVSGTRTIIGTGADNPHNLKVSPEIIEKLQKIKNLTEELVSCYGKNIHKKINLIINSLPAYRKKHIINIITQLKELQEDVRKQTKNKEQESKSKEEEEASITINKKAYAGVIVKINHITKKIEKTTNLKTIFTASSVTKENETAVE